MAGWAAHAGEMATEADGTHPTGMHSCNLLNLTKNFDVTLLPLADLRGGRQGRVPPRGSKFFHFHAVFGKNLKNNSNFGSWRTPLGKILDPPLITINNSSQTESKISLNTSY